MPDLNTFLIAKVSVGLMIIVLFPYGLINASAQAPTYNTIGFKVGENSYPVSYHFTNGGTIDNISSQSGDVLRINFTSQSEGNLEIVLPREVSDAVSFTVSSEPTLILDGLLVPNTQIPLTRSCEQTSFIVPVKAGYHHIELGGVVVLAFGPGYPENVFLPKTIVAEGKNFIVYFRTDAKKCDVTFSKEQKKIHLDIIGRVEANNTNYGIFEFWVPQTLLGGNFSVLADGKPVSFMEGNSDYVRSFDKSFNGTLLQFKYPKDATSIDIIGTIAMPEFSSAGAILMAASIASIIVLSKRNFRVR